MREHLLIMTISHPVLVDPVKYFLFSLCVLVAMPRTIKLEWVLEASTRSI